MRDILKILMVHNRWPQFGNNSRGDTLIEVTLALSILGAVLIGAMVIASGAFRTGQTAKERTEVASASQGQMEALRSFRDNHTWTEFRNGVDGAAGGCALGGGPCFHMVLQTIGATTEWVPQAGGVAANVPGSIIEISPIGGISRACAYDFLLKYQFTTLGGGATASNRIQTRLTNLRFTPADYPGVSCP